MKYESVLLLTYDTLGWIPIFRDIWILTRITKTTK